MGRRRLKGSRRNGFSAVRAHLDTAPGRVWIAGRTHPVRRAPFQPRRGSTTIARGAKRPRDKGRKIPTNPGGVEQAEPYPCSNCLTRSRGERRERGALPSIPTSATIHQTVTRRTYVPEVHSPRPPRLRVNLFPFSTAWRRLSGSIGSPNPFWETDPEFGGNRAVPCGRYSCHSSHSWFRQIQGVSNHE